MARFDLENYETVADRITRFWQEYPNGRIVTQMEYISESGKQFVVKASVFKESVESRANEPDATGYAEEHFSDRGPNETSPLENCETSAIGRALANMGYATTSESRPSREEMKKVQRDPEKAAEIKEQVRSNSPKVKITEYPKWNTIVQAASANPGDEFLKDIVGKGQQYGELTQRQLSAAFNKATKLLDTTPRSKEVQLVADSFPGAVDERPF